MLCTVIQVVTPRFLSYLLLSNHTQPVSTVVVLTSLVISLTLLLIIPLRIGRDFPANMTASPIASFPLYRVWLVPVGILTEEHRPCLELFDDFLELRFVVDARTHSILFSPSSIESACVSAIKQEFIR